MAIKRINYTDRQRILREHAQIRLRRIGNSTAFKATLDLSSYIFAPTARVTVEAYRSVQIKRFDFGTVACPAPESYNAIPLDDFGTPDGVLFNVKVTDCDGRPGLLLGEADGIQPSENDDDDSKRLSLLPVVPAELGQEVWQVAVEGSRAFLKVNSASGDHKALAATPFFKSLVYPAALRQILVRVLIEDRICDAEDSDEALAMWLTFGLELTQQKPPVMSPEGGDAEDAEARAWIEDVVSEFCRRHKLMNALKTSLAPEGEA